MSASVAFKPSVHLVRNRNTEELILRYPLVLPAVGRTVFMLLCQYLFVFNYKVVSTVIPEYICACLCQRTSWLSFAKDNITKRLSGPFEF